MRYIRSPGAPNGHATNRDAGQPGAAQIADAHAVTGHIQSRRPRPAGTGRSHSSSTNSADVDTGVPIGTSPITGPLCQRCADGRIHHRLGGAVGVEHHPARAPNGPPPRPGRPRRRSATTPTPVPSGHERAVLALAEEVWINTLTCSATSSSWKSSGERATGVGDHHQPPAVQQRTPESPHREVESDYEWHCVHTCTQGGQVRRRMTPTIGHVAVGNGHTLWGTRSCPRCR